MTTSKLKLILAAALFAVPVPAFAQIPPLQDIVTLEEICIGGAAGFTDEHAVTIQCPVDPASARRSPPPNWEMTIPGARHWAKDVCSERDSLRSDRACYAAFLRQQIINREEDRVALCRQERINVREGLIGTAPLPGEEGISETNSTPACHRRNTP